MSMTHEMIKQNVMDWLDALVVGAKAITQPMLCEPLSEEDAWKGTASCFENTSFMEDDGSLYVMIHKIKKVAEAAEFDVTHRVFTPADGHYPYFTGEYFFIYNGVKFGDVYGTFSESGQEERKRERQDYIEKQNEREQSSNSESSETKFVDNE